MSPQVKVVSRTYAIPEAELLALLGPLDPGFYLAWAKVGWDDTGNVLEMRIEKNIH